jgi:hypothetical protein
MTVAAMSNVATVERRELIRVSDWIAAWSGQRPQ